MSTVSIRDLRNHGGDVLARVTRGESLVVTRDGEEVAVLSPLPRRSLTPHELVARRRLLPLVDVDRLRADIDEVVDQSL